MIINRDRATRKRGMHPFFVITLSLFFSLAGALVMLHSGGPLARPASAAPRFNLPRTNSVIAPSSYLNASARPSGQVAPRAVTSETVLYDQYDGPGVNAVTSQNFEPQFDVYDAQAADDFDVPSGQVWTVSSVEVAGVYSITSGFANSVNVYFYTTDNSTGLPSTPVITETNVSYDSGPNAGDFVIPLRQPVTLNEGTYWLSVQANQNFDPNSQWFWRNRYFFSGHPAAWRNPGGGFITLGSCLDNWGTRSTDCFREQPIPEPDQVFRLLGSLGGTATPTFTGTPPTATRTRTPRPIPPTVTGTHFLPSPVGTPAAPIPTATQGSPTTTPIPACGLAWRPVDSSSRPADASVDELRSVAVVSPTDIWAIGDYAGASPVYRTLTMHWDGTAWTYITSPNIGDANNFLMAVSAGPGGSLWAAGYYSQNGTSSTLTMRWDGSQWVLVTSPNRTNQDILLGVAAIGTNDVWAVGASLGQTLTMHWTGTAWAIVTSPSPSTVDNILTAVSGSSSTNVWAVGSYFNTSTGTHSLLTLRWTGSQWNIVQVSNIGVQDGRLNGVAAVSPTEVWAVGYYTSASGDSALVIRWDGVEWSGVLVDEHTTAVNYRLSAVTAAASNNVWAVGYTNVFGHENLTLILHCNFSTCVRVPSYNYLPDPNVNWLNGVAAASATDVWTVGTYGFPGQFPLIERYNDPCGAPTGTPTVGPTFTPTGTYTPSRTSTGTATPTLTGVPTGTATSVATNTPPANTPTPCARAWSVVSSPNVGAGTNRLNGVAAVADNDVWAVGYHCATDCSHSNEIKTLIEHWNGTSWSVVSNPDVGLYNTFQGVTAVSSNDVWAVGYSYNGSIVQTLIEHWNGTSWSLAFSPNVGTSTNYLNGVTTVSANDVWAVGSYCNTNCSGSDLMTLIEHWDGTEWSVVSSPYAGALNGVSAVAANDVWAVGFVRISSTIYTRVEHWNGTAWSVVFSPDPSASDNELYGVAAVAANDVWAVGSYGYPEISGMIEHWDGTSWSVSYRPLSGFDNEFDGVAAVSANDVWAVGYNEGGHALTQHWNGTAWSVVSNPNVGTASYLKGVAAVSAGNVWAVGSSSNGSAPGRTLVEHYTSLCATPTSTPASTATPCAISFTDVHPTDYFYGAVLYLACHGAISGYADGTFRPFNDTTRSQLTKIVVLAVGLPIDTTGGPHFTDVPTTQPFYVYIETAYNRHIISGYGDGTFRPFNNITRGQLSKVIVIALGWSIDTTGGPHFTDVPAGPNPARHPFYDYVETAFNHHAISGYGDNTFRPGNNATRGQIATIIFRALSQAR